MTRAAMKRAFNVALGTDPREADYGVMELLCKVEQDETSAVAEYIWDHWMGEPEHPTVEQVYTLINKAIIEGND